MKTAIRFTTGLSLQILLIGATGFFGTFLSEYLESVGSFGDYINKSGIPEWGARHIWYVWTLVFLVFAQIVRVIMWMDAFWSEENELKRQQKLKRNRYE